jgi:hypothetical protein
LPVGELKDRGVHVHVPAGAVPKDGPSAGVTMTTALASLLSGRPVRSDVAMTGEVSLTGRVLPIGGVKQKLLAAHRAGITTVLIPQRNEPDLDDVPAEVLEKLRCTRSAMSARCCGWRSSPRAGGVNPNAGRGTSNAGGVKPKDGGGQVEIRGRGGQVEADRRRGLGCRAGWYRHVSGDPDAPARL